MLMNICCNAGEQVAPNDEPGTSHQLDMRGIDEDSGSTGMSAKAGMSAKGDKSYQTTRNAEVNRNRNLAIIYGS